MSLFNFCKKQASKPISLPGNFFKKLLFTSAAIGIVWATADVVCNPEKARNELKGYEYETREKARQKQAYDIINQALKSGNEEDYNKAIEAYAPCNFGSYTKFTKEQKRVFLEKSRDLIERYWKIK